MNKTLISAACALALAGSAQAADWALSGNVALTTDYVFRGFTQTDADPAVQGGLDLKHANGFIAGVWGSNVESDPAAPLNYNGANMELDVYLGWNGKISNSGLDLTAKALRYNYPGTHTDANNTNEFSLYLGYDFGGPALSAGVNYSPDFYGLDRAWYWDAGLNIPISKATLSLHIGATDFEDDLLADDYVDYSIGVSGEVAGLGLALKYTGTDGVSAGCTQHTCDDRVAFTVSKSF
jgi:uncharacterized protein (TIGR02001 family)